MPPVLPEDWYLAGDSVWNSGGKRCFDIAAAFLGLCLLLPALLLIAVVIQLVDGAPVLYSETRLGRSGKPFLILKFRTLRSGSDREPRIAPEDDPRITRCGRWLRRWRLDEFPQLINVLRGDMSLVGPRPLPASHADGVSEHTLELLLSVRPGLTDPAAIFFLAEDAVLVGHPEAEKIYFERFFPLKIRMATEAAAETSFVGDLTMLLRTLARLWSPRARRRSAQALRKLLQ